MTSNHTSRYREDTYDFEFDDTENNDAGLPLPSKLIFAVHYEYAPETRGDRVTPGESADVNILDVTLKHVAPFDGCWVRAYREPTIQERALANVWLFTQVRRSTVAYHQLLREILAQEERVY